MEKAMKDVITLPGIKASPAAMPTVRLPYIKRYPDRTGKMRAYFRRPGFPTVVLPGNPGSKEFMAAYCAAMAMVPVAPIAPKPAAVKTSRIAVGTVGAAIEAYQRSAEWKALAAATAGPRRHVLAVFGRSHDLPLSKVTTAAIREVTDSMPPGTGKKWLNGIRAMFAHAIATDQFPGPNPCDGIAIKIPASDGHHTWTEAQIAQYEARHPIGTPARRLFTLALFTGQRRGDLVEMGQHNIKDGKLVIRQHKTKAVVTIPIHPELAGCSTRRGRTSRRHSFSASKAGRCAPATSVSCSATGAARPGSPTSASCTVCARRSAGGWSRSA
jgi:hypothetical protein